MTATATATSTSTTTSAVDDVESDTVVRQPWRTILFNCECHSFEDVELQLVKAIKCGLSKAREYSWEVHTKGSAVVYSGERERCRAVATVLEAIGLKVKVAG